MAVPSPSGLMMRRSPPTEALRPAGRALLSEITRMTADTTDTGRAEPDNRTYGLHVWPPATRDE
jgi:hypothetical protein